MRRIRSVAIFVVIGVLGVAASGCEKGRRARSLVAGSSGRFALLAGASGEESEPNFFTEDLQGLRGALALRGWTVNVVAGSRDGLTPGSVRATNQNLVRGVHETLQSASSGQEVLLIFHSHGRERETYWGQRSHSIVSEDRDASGSDPGFDLDAIEPDLLEAGSRGVRVGLVDLSCYSGATQALHGPACTVTLAASSYVSLCSGREQERHFNSRFFSLPPAGTSTDLESLFLEARRFDRDSINLPRISSRPTPALQGWEDFLAGADPLDTFEDIKSFRTGTPPFDPKKLLSELDRWAATQPAVAAQPKWRELRARIEKQLGQALALRKSLESQMPALAHDYDDATLAVRVPGRAPMQLGVGYLAELLQAARDGQAPDGYTQVQRNLLKAITPVRGTLATRFSQPLAGFRARRDRYDRDTDAFARSADALFNSERELYELQPEPSTSNPCRDFVL